MAQKPKYLDDLIALKSVGVLLILENGSLRGVLTSDDDATWTLMVGNGLNGTFDFHVYDVKNINISQCVVYLKELNHG